MATSQEAGLALIKSFEGCKLEAYKCPAGIWTIGYGRTTGVRPEQRITQEQAEAWLLAEYRAFELEVRRLVRVTITGNQLAALTSFAYNVGVSALASSTLLKKLNARDYAGAGAQFARWDKAGGRALAGLTRRRAAEAALFNR